MTFPLAERVQRIKPSPTLAISARADALEASGKPIINLSVGEPDFDTPDFIKDAAIQAIRDGRTRYTAVDGIQPLKQAIVRKFSKDNHLDYALNQVLVSCGAKHSIFNALIAILQPQDEVIIPAPYWVSYPDMVLLAEGQPVIVKTDFSQHFKLTPAQLEAAITPKTRILILNSPSNPTGQAYHRDELQALGDVLLRHPQVMVISDDIYEQHLWNHTPYVNLLNVTPALYDRCLVVNGVSKTYAMTGWRIGYAAGPAPLIAAMKKAQSQSTSNPCSIAQYAALAALEGDQGCVANMTAAYRQRHDFLVGELNTLPGVECLPSDGTFYAFPRVQALFNPERGMTDLAFAECLLDKLDIAIVPGSAFGAPEHIRICYTTSMEQLVEAVKRLRQWL